MTKKKRDFLKWTVLTVVKFSCELNEFVDWFLWQGWPTGVVPRSLVTVWPICSSTIPYSRVARRSRSQRSLARHPPNFPLFREKSWFLLCCPASIWIFQTDLFPQCSVWKSRKKGHILRLVSRRLCRVRRRLTSCLFPFECKISLFMSTLFCVPLAKFSAYRRLEVSRTQ